MTQPTLIDAPTKRAAPLRAIIRQRIGCGGPQGGARLYFWLECGHVQERMLKAKYNDLERVRCPQCAGLPPNANEAMVAAGGMP